MSGGPEGRSEGRREGRGRRMGWLQQPRSAPSTLSLPPSVRCWSTYAHPHRLIYNTCSAFPLSPSHTHTGREQRRAEWASTKVNKVVWHWKRLIIHSGDMETAHVFSCVTQLWPSGGQVCDCHDSQRITLALSHSMSDDVHTTLQCSICIWNLTDTCSQQSTFNFKLNNMVT